MDDGPVIDMEPDSSGKRVSLTVTPEAHQILGLVEVLHTLDFLFDNGPGIEVAGDVVACGSDELDASFMGLLVGVGADECR